MKKLIEICGLYKVYKGEEQDIFALNNISLTIREGEFVAIIGQSGSGKSTLMNMIGCLDLPTDGSYFLDGKNVRHFSDDGLSRIRNQTIGFIFQGFNLIPGLTAMENTELPLLYRGIPKEKRTQMAVCALNKVGLGSRLTHKPNQLSGGQQQRVAIARAIAAKPSILLADEPTGNLDSKSGLEIMQIIDNLHLEGRTIILITHDEGIAGKAQRVIRIGDGKIISDNG